MKKLQIKSFYIFNPDLKSKKRKPTEDEQQSAKILYYYPNEEDEIIKRSNTGIIEGTLGFLNEFQADDSEFIYVELFKNIYISKRYEENFYLTFILEKSKDNQKNVEFYSHNLETKKQWYKTLLDNFYDMLVLWHGNLKAIFFSDNLFKDPNSSFTSVTIRDAGVSEINKLVFEYDIREDAEKYKLLTELLNDFIKGYKEGLIYNRIPLLENILYFPLTEMTYTKVLLSTQRLNEKLLDMKYISIIYKGYLLHNDSPLDSFSIVYNSFFSNFDGTAKYNNFAKPNYLVSQTIYSSDLQSNSIKERNRSDFRKAFENANYSFLLGIQKININNYHVFIPKIYLKSKDEYVKLLVYNFNGLIIFIYLNESFNYFTNLNMLISLEKWIKRYFEMHLNILENLYIQKLAKLDTNSFSYFNNSNKSIKLSSNFYNKKTKLIDPEKISALIKIFRLNYHNQVSSLTRLKSYYVYYLNTCERKLVILLPETLSIPNLINSIDEIKKDLLYDYIFIL